MVTDIGSDRSAEVLFGATRRAVLALLLGRPDERFYLREIQRAIGAGIGPVQRELRQLADAGLIRREAHGNQVHFSANRSAPIFPELQSIVQKTTGTAEVLRVSMAALMSQGLVDLAFVYGSVAAGRQTAVSDVDVLVVGEASLADVAPALKSAQSKLGREVNATVYSRAELRAKVKGGSAFLKRVLSGPRLMITGTDHDAEKLAR
ncbi:MAG: nucleotidyltransferase domain-containing protein [Gemmatimonadota bacterium]